MTVRYYEVDFFLNASWLRRFRITKVFGLSVRDAYMDG